MPEVISNASPLQYLFPAGVLDLLPAVYRRIIVPKAVADEVSRGRARGVVLPDIAALPWAVVREVSQGSLLPLVTDLGAGEREVLALAIETPEALVLLDDGIARRHARLLGIVFTGTLGVLLKGKQSGYLPAVAPILARLDSLRFYLDADTRAAVLKAAGEAR